MNLLPPEKIQAVEKCFNEGRGIRETERLTGVHRDTVSRYFRLFAAPLKDRDPDDWVSANYEVVEHDDNWHVFCWHDSTPEWWRHIATFHTEKRAQAYAADQASWIDAIRSSEKGEIEDESLYADEPPAPIEHLPEPPAAPPPVEERERPLTKEERAAARERHQDELAAAIPPRHCEVCGTQLVRRPGEPVSNFKIRKTCSPEHAQQLIMRSRAEREHPAAVAAAEAPPEPRDGEDDPWLEETSIPLAAAAQEAADRPAVTPPGYRECPDCVWSGPVTDYRYHRQTDHGA